jgi:hypothetical protein
MTANHLYAVRFVATRAGTLGKIAILNLAAVVGNLKLAIYDEASGLPGTRLYVSGDISTNATGVLSASPAFATTAGTTYWIAGICSATLTSVEQITGAGYDPELGFSIVGTVVSPANGINHSHGSYAMPDPFDAVIESDLAASQGPAFWLQWSA